MCTSLCQKIWYQRKYDKNGEIRLPNLGKPTNQRTLEIIYTQGIKLPTTYDNYKLIFVYKLWKENNKCSVKTKHLLNSSFVIRRQI